jgi:hypothetical protein
MSLHLITRDDYHDYFGDRYIGWNSIPNIGQHRDSTLLDQSNFDAAWNRLNELSKHLTIPGDDNFPESDSCQIIRMNHWAVGWVESIVIHPSDVSAVKEAELIQEDMSGYPVLDDEDYSDREYQATMENILTSLRMLGFGADEKMGKDIYNWLSRNDDYALEDCDDTGAWVPDNVIMEAIEGICQNKTRHEMDMAITDETVRYFHKED